MILYKRLLSLREKKPSLSTWYDLLDVIWPFVSEIIRSMLIFNTKYKIVIIHVALVIHWGCENKEWHH